MDFEDRLYHAMHEAGVHIEGNIDWRDREFQRFSAKGHWNRKRHLFVVLLHGGASFGDWRDPSTWKTIWEKSWLDLSREEKQKRDDDLKRLTREKELIRSHARWRAALLLEHKTWRGQTCKEASFDHPYVKAKRIIPYYAYQIRSYLVLPIHDIDGALISLQYIKPNGDKRFKRKASPKGGFMFLGETIKRNIDIIWICEGWATGCSIYEAVGQHVVCSMGASNLEAVTYSFRIKYPNNKIIVCADNDKHLTHNTGLETAIIAARNGGAILKVPSISGDFNDLFCSYGIEEVENQLLNLK